MAIKDTKSQLRAKIRWGIAGILVLLVVTSFFVAPKSANKVIDAVNSSVALGIPNISDEPFSLGLDLQGGAHLVYKADVSGIPALDQPEALEGVRDVIEQRVNGIGVGEPSIQTNKVGEEYRVIVELPGVTDVQQAIEMIGETPILEFREENNEPARELTVEEEKGIEQHNEEVRKKANEVYGQIVEGVADFATVARENSDDSNSAVNGGYIGYVSRAELPSEVFEILESLGEGEVANKLVETETGYHIVKRGAERDGELEVTASHILICYLGSTGCENPVYTKEEAKAKAEELFQQANADNFADLAREYSTGPSAEDGGDLGTFKKGQMIEEFANAVFAAEVGQITGPVETEFGYHVIYKRDEKPSKEYEMYEILFRTQRAEDILPPQEPYLPTGLSGSQLDRAEVVTDQQTGAIQVSLHFDSEGKELFKEITERNLGKAVAIYLDGSPISVPVVNQVITNGQAVITGSFTFQEARLLAQRLNAGALPVPVELISQQQVGATLGSESLSTSLRAGALALVLVMIFMILYYRLPGVLAVIALSLYMSITLAIFKVMGVTLTLAGIAGFILSIGMAVDANVLIFERLKEELQDGKSLKAAVEEAFLRAWTSIRDGNISTLFTSAILIWFGSSFVQGFAVTLAIGIFVSMFSAITITRVMLRFVVPWFGDKGGPMFLGYKKQEEK